MAESINPEMCVIIVNKPKNGCYRFQLSYSEYPYVMLSSFWSRACTKDSWFFRRSPIIFHYISSAGVFSAISASAT